MIAADDPRIERYLDLVERWNSTYNLTAVREREAMRVQHVADCLAAIPPLRARLPQGRVLDVGSGGGLPGVLIAIALPEIAVTCCDAVGKKAAFVRHVAAELGLPNLTAVHARVERWHAPPFDAVVSRAFATLAAFTRLTRHVLADGGIWMAMKGRVPADEIAAVAMTADVFHVEPLVVPGLDAERCLVWMRPIPPAPDHPIRRPSA